MQDFKYEELLSDDGAWVAMMQQFYTIKSDCLKPCRDAYVMNLDRSICFSRFPVDVAYFCFVDTYSLFHAFQKVTGKTEFTAEEIQNAVLDPKMADKLLLNQGGVFIGDEKVRETLMRELIVPAIANFSKQSQPGMESMKAILTSIVLESWLFFEAFVSDLWVTAVDNAKGEISNRIQRATTEWLSDDDDPKKGGISRKKVLGASATIDSRTHPGSFRRELGMVSFQRIHLIKHFYQLAFGKDVSKCFVSSSPFSIQALSAVRNAFSHSAGKADESFRNGAAMGIPDFRAITQGQEIPLNGDNVKKLRAAAAETGCALLKYVDGCLQDGNLI